MITAQFLTRYVGFYPFLKKHLKQVVCSLLFLAGANFASGQIVIYTEDFGTDLAGCLSQGTFADGFVGADGGVWAVNGVGTGNNWYISSAEGGQTAGNCSSNCATGGPQFNKTLHIATALFGADQNANYLETFGNFDRIAELPPLDFSGLSEITISFDFIHIGNEDDKCTLEYFDGAQWVEISVLPSVVAGLCGGTGEVEWGNFSTTLSDLSVFPDLTNAKLGFRWVHDQNTPTELKSVAIDNIVIDTPPMELQAGFTVTTTDVCMDSCIDFSDQTTGEQIVSWAWTFEGGNPATSNSQNPSVCYDTEGVFEVTLTVEDIYGQVDDLVQAGYITVSNCSTGPNISFTPSDSSPCEQECISFNNFTTGSNPGNWQWVFEGGSPGTSTDENPTNICYQMPGTYDVILTATDDYGTHVDTVEIVVEDCIQGPSVSFTADQPVFCLEGCVQFTDQSVGENIVSWEWIFNGGEPSTWSGQTPPPICYENLGVFSVTLIAVDDQGETSYTAPNFIINDDCQGPPEANFQASETTICTGDCVDFTNLSLAVDYTALWSFQGAETTISTEVNPPPICYNEPGVYDVSLVIANSFGSDGIVMQDYITVESCLNPPVPRITVATDTICAGTCTSFMDASTGLGINEWQWLFPGAETTLVNTQNAPEVCYNNPGTYNVILSITGAGGEADETFEDVITVIADESCRPEINVSFNDIICAGTCTTFEAQVTNADSVKWTFPSGIPSESNQIDPGLICFPDTTGEFMVSFVAYNAAGVTAFTDTLFISEAPQLSAGPDLTIDLGETVTLSATPAQEGSYLWQPFELINNHAFTERVVSTTPDESTMYIVYYTVPGGCTLSDTVMVNVNYVASIGVPSAFSPNGDGFNDVLKVEGNGITSLDFRIFNRFGEEVFHSVNQEKGWDGTHKGEDLNPGVYIYSLEVVLLVEDETDSTVLKESYQVLSGDVTLVR